MNPIIRTRDIYEKFVDTVKGLEPRQEFTQFISYQTWLREFATYQIDLGRQTGKTSTIIHGACKDDVIITHNHHMKTYIRNTFSELDQDMIGLYSVQNLPNRAVFPFERHGKTVVWVDEPSFTLNTGRCVYDWLGEIYDGNTRIKIIMLGA